MAASSAGEEHLASIDHSSFDTRGRERAVWIVNLTQKPQSVEVIQDAVRLESVALAAGSRTLAPSIARGSFLSGRGSDAFLMLEAPVDLTASGFEVHKADGSTHAPEWAVQSLSGIEALSAGQRGEAHPVIASDLQQARLSIAVGFLAPGTAVMVRVAGTEKIYSAVSSDSAALMLDLGPLAESDRAHPPSVEFAVLAGRASGGAFARDSQGGVHNPVAAAISPLVSGGGSGSYSHTYDSKTTSFKYTVSGAPPNVCGDIYTTRNGSLLVTAGWMCTDASGQGTKGPWTCGVDQTDKTTYIRWPDGSETTRSNHWCDVNTPIISGLNATFPQPQFNGMASDLGPWGTGFDASFLGWTFPSVSYQDLTTGLYWDSSYPNYCYCSSTKKEFAVTVNPTVGWLVQWISSFTPPALRHVAGHRYRWQVKGLDDFFYRPVGTVDFTY